MLGYNFFIIGRVVKGLSLAHKYVYPTANIFVLNNKILPIGVFYGKVFIEKYYDDIISIGNRPTLNRNLELSVEVHILDFKIYYHKGLSQYHQNK